jgi:hypothetical protein
MPTSQGQPARMESSKAKHDNIATMSKCCLQHCNNELFTFEIIVLSRAGLSDTLYTSKHQLLYNGQTNVFSEEASNDAQSAAPTTAKISQ